MKIRDIPLLKYIPFVFIVLLLIKIINQTNSFESFILDLFSVITPIFIGIIIAIVLSPAVYFFEKKLKIHHNLGVFLVYLIFILFLSALIRYISPLIYRSFIELRNNLPAYIDNVQNTKFNIPYIGEFNFLDSITSLLNKITLLLTSSINDLIQKGISAISTTAKVTMNFFISIIVSIYILIDYKNFKISIKKFLYAFFNITFANKLIKFTIQSNNIFSKYIIGKLILCLIMSIISSLGFAIINIPYSLLFGIIIGITNLIPYIGPFIGSIPVITLGLLISPITGVLALIVIIVVQQLDNTIIGPKVLSDQVGVSPFEILFSIVVGGALFGIVGMIFSVPIFAIFKILYDIILDNKLKNKNIEL